MILELSEIDRYTKEHLYKFLEGKCKEKFTKSDVKYQLNMNDVTLIGGGIDEAPMAYKDIKKVMKNQQELVEVLGTFTPKIVRMDK